MREVFQQELREVQDRLVELADLVAVSIEKATRSFNDSNVSLAEEVIADKGMVYCGQGSLDVGAAMQKNVSGYQYWFHRRLDYRALVKA